MAKLNITVEELAAWLISRTPLPTKTEGETWANRLELGATRSKDCHAFAARMLAEVQLTDEEKEGK